MQRKHVRFAPVDEDLVPPMGYTSRSLSSASSTGPLTPPSHTFGLPGPTPYAFPPSSPKLRATPTRLHSLVEYSTSPIIYYDFVDPPSAMSSRRDRISSRTLTEPATSPPMESMTLISPHLPWRVPVIARNGSSVSIMDIIDAIYHSLRTQIGEPEYKLLPTSRDQERASAAYRQRYKRYRDRRTHDEEKRQGLRRIDFLMGHSKFRGLSRTDSGPSTWFLNFG